MPLPPRDLLTWLRAAGEPTRLRLLALCAARELSVSDIAQIVGQSEPRVSRHLKILGEAGLIERLRQGQWVHYGLARGGAAAGFVQGLLGQLDRADPQLARDRERMQAPRSDGLPAGAPATSRLGRQLRGFVESAEAVTPAGAVLLVGADHPELIETAAGMGAECAVLAHSRRSAQLARSMAERMGLHCRVLLATGGGALGARDLARLGRTFDAVLLDRLETPDEALGGLLTASRRALSPGGRLLLFERYDSLESSRERVVEHPLARLRRLLSEAGLTCERMSPIEADGQHVLAAAAVPGVERPRGTASAA
ncbi:MAG TPA: metalloregulator ArsR/SmtB family transcription factor [Steroidobacteraceae bacterium]|jgi:DNA-binding transcriptional ArsR family regulator|nr:metalloregulator ArsR/SmtB family transcription factor [Steroidobacteraceae bacterium]